jgi:hypothetical protein
MAGMMNSRKRNRFFEPAFHGALGLLAGTVLFIPSRRAHPVGASSSAASATKGSG